MVCLSAIVRGIMIQVIEKDKLLKYLFEQRVTAIKDLEQERNGVDKRREVVRLKANVDLLTRLYRTFETW